MAKLRHIAVSTPDLEKSAKFYEEVFDMKIMSQQDHAVRMSDGVVNLTLLKFKSDEHAGDERGKDFCGWHHVGFIVDDLDETSRKIEEHGGKIHRDMPSGNPGSHFEKKFRDPLGLVFDISKEWEGTS